eukprot:CAMPEP_0172604518 /NCGR_PEP_ID=MMETSP1068-20121228/24776_1 /TAXON_ID=35684 /ORGANISM="Pseudopedinella elastica, Strain CCMP716" /LENGTH=73 /DNA_ID=CAMNT_0013406619 /DNA_START=80 /DNA_END=301 /DNA_ORIENTATION=-
MAPPRSITKRNDKHAANINKRGNVVQKPKDPLDIDGPNLSKPMIYFLAFVIIGSSVLGFIAQVLPYFTGKAGF